MARCVLLIRFSSQFLGTSHMELHPLSQPIVSPTHLSKQFSRNVPSGALPTSVESALGNPT